jgi:cytochrome c nitrite reductase small subunit
MEIKKRKIFSVFYPPPQWRVPVIIALGILTGLGAYIFNISNAASYLSNDPKACVNCHVMYPQFATWERGSHGRVATCNDCHVPHDNIFSTYFFKASDGLRHATMFTFRLEPQVIQIKEAGIEAVQNNCIRCHTSVIHPVSLRGIDARGIHEDGRLCWDCHREVPHGRVNSLSSTPYARVPQLEPVTPKWLKEYLKTETSKQAQKEVKQ